MAPGMVTGELELWEGRPCSEGLFRKCLWGGSFTEIIKSNKKVVVIPHSMGVNYLLHFLKWVEASPPMGGGGSPGWCAKYIKSIINIRPAVLGIPKVVPGMLSAEGREVVFVRAMAPGLVDWYSRAQNLERMMRVSRTWDSVISLLPKGVDSIWHLG